MPDGSVATKTTSPGKLMHEDMRQCAAKALERALADVGPTLDVEQLRARFAYHSRDQLAQACQLWGVEVERAEENGRKVGHELALRQLSQARAALSSAIAQTPELATRLGPIPTSAFDRFGKEQLVAFVRAGVDHFVLGLRNAHLTFLGQITRAEVPTLDRRTRCVYAAAAAGQALGGLLVAMWKGAGDDALLLRTMRDAAHDAMVGELGEELDVVVGKAN